MKMKKGTFMLIDVAISGDKNVIMKEAVILKYKDFTIEIQPVITEATGTIS